MAKATVAETLAKLAEACAKAHINLEGSEDGESVAALVRFTPGSKEQYIDAENAVLHVLALVGMPRSGSRWGNTSDGVGGQIGLEQGYARIMQSGVPKVLAKKLYALKGEYQYADVWAGIDKATVTAGTQKRQAKKAKAEAAKAETFVDGEVAKAKGKRAKPITCTAEEIVAERDGKGLSWAQVAINLNLGSPGAARRTYTQLTGKPHTDSQMSGKRAPRGSRASGRKLAKPDWNDDTDQDEIIGKLQGAWHEPSGDPGTKNYVPGHWTGSNIAVSRTLGGRLKPYEEEVAVARVVEFSFGKNEDQPLQVTVIDRESGAQRCFFVSTIISVQ